MKPKIKICGITNLPDAERAVQLGADLLGFNFYPASPRYLTPKAAADIIGNLTGSAVAVGLFVNAGIDTIEETLTRCPLGMAQLHGDETNEDCQNVAQLGVKVIKALRIRKPNDIDQARLFHVDAILLDAFQEHLFGGTGQSFDWSWIKSSPQQKIFLAGGITPYNIKQALAAGTYGVDLCSGVEKSPGIKDPQKMKFLFQEIAQYRP